MQNQKTDNSKIHVLEVIGAMNPGGAENLLMNITRNCPESLAHFDFLENSTHKSFFTDELRQRKSEVMQVPRFLIFNYFSYRHAVDCFFKNSVGKWDIVHGHIESSAFIYLKIAKKYGFVTVVHSHNASSGHGLKSLLKRIFFHKMVKYADGYIACSEAAAINRFGKDIGNNKTYILKNGVDIQRFAFNASERTEIRLKLGIPQDAFVIGNIARACKEKNQIFLLKVLASLNNSCNQKKAYYLIIVGSGPLFGKLCKQSDKLGIKKYVRFVGRVNDQAPYYSAFDLFCLPSLYEGFPLTINESLANGLQCFLSDRISKETGISKNVFFIPLDVNLWKQYIIKSVSTHRQVSCIGKYEIKNVVNDYVDYLKNIIKKVKKT